MNDSNNVGIVETLKMLNEKYGTGFILPLEDDKPKFVPERLLGVETNVGFITECQICSDEKLRVLTGDGGLWYWELKSLKFYISDESDETVSFEEYVKLFYNTENT